MADISFDGLEFNYGPGNANWYVDSAVYHTAPNALRSGVITHNQTSRIDLVNPGVRGNLTFYWRTSSESNYDWLTFYINGIFQERISGNNSFVERTYEIYPGDTVYWIYSKDGSVSSFNDAGYLDSFSFTEWSSSSASSSSISSSSAAQTSYILPNFNSDFTLIGPAGSGLVSSGNGRWNYRSTATGSSQTGPSVPPPGPDIYYWYCETSGTTLGSVYTMTLNDILDSSLYNFTVNFYYSNYGSTGGGECLVQYWDGASWVTVQTIGWDTVSSAWKSATPIDLSAYSNADGQIRWQFTTGGTTTYRNDFALDWIRIIADTKSSSSESSSSTSSSSSSSSTSSSESLSSATWTWGHQTGVPTGYAVTFSSGRVIPWTADEIVGSGDDEKIVMRDDERYAWSEPAYTGPGEDVYLLYNQYAGSRDDSRFTILYRTGATRQDCLASGWRTYSQLDEPLTSLGWMQFSFTINSVSSSSASSSSSSSESLDCTWETYNGGLSDWDIYQDEGVNLAGWSGSVWTSVIHHLDSDFGGSEYGGASYIYLTPKVPWNKAVYARITHNRNISDIGGQNPRFKILAANDDTMLEENQYLSDTIVPVTNTYVGGLLNLALFKFYHTGATPFQISNIEFCNSSSSSSVSSSSSISSSSSSSSCVPTYVETKGPTYWPAGDGVWDGYGYTAVSNGDWTVSLFATGGPLGEAQPSRIRITLNNFAGWDPVGYTIVVEDTASNVIYSSGIFDLDGDTVPTTVAFEPTYVGVNPIWFIRIEGGDDKFYVTSVQLYEDCGTGSFSSSSSSSSVSSSSSSTSSSSSSSTCWGYDPTGGYADRIGHQRVSLQRLWTDAPPDVVWNDAWDGVPPGTAKTRYQETTSMQVSNFGFNAGGFSCARMFIRFYLYSTVLSATWPIRPVSGAYVTTGLLGNHSTSIQLFGYTGAPGVPQITDYNAYTVNPISDNLCVPNISPTTTRTVKWKLNAYGLSLLNAAILGPEYPFFTVCLRETTHDVGNTPKVDTPIAYVEISDSFEANKVGIGQYCDHLYPTFNGQN